MKLMFNRKGVSTVIVTVLLIALTIVAVAVVWAVVNNLLKEKMASTEACFGNFGKVNINSQYTCVDSSGNFQFSIDIGDIDVEKVIVGISGAGTIKSFTISNSETIIPNLAKYQSTGFGTDLIKLPEKNGGSTYVTNFFAVKPDSIKIAPIIDGQQCEVSDTLSEIDSCQG